MYDFYLAERQVAQLARDFAHCASENEKFLALRENLLILGDQMALFSSPEALNLIYYNGFNDFVKKKLISKCMQHMQICRRLEKLLVVFRSGPDQGKVRKFYFDSEKIDFLKKNQGKLTEI